MFTSICPSVRERVHIGLSVRVNVHICLSVCPRDCSHLSVGLSEKLFLSACLSEKLFTSACLPVCPRNCSHLPVCLSERVFTSVCLSQCSRLSIRENAHMSKSERAFTSIYLSERMFPSVCLSERVFTSVYLRERSYLLKNIDIYLSISLRMFISSEGFKLGFRSQFPITISVRIHIHPSTCRSCYDYLNFSKTCLPNVYINLFFSKFSSTRYDIRKYLGNGILGKRHF